MTVAIMQPGYLPWMGFFELIHRSDVFVVYDNVQYDKNGWRNRNSIKTAQGPQWLTVPVHSKGKPLIREIKIDNSKDWSQGHLRALELNYCKAPYFRKYFSPIKRILTEKWQLLIDLDMALIKFLAGELGLKKEMIFSSQLAVKNDRVGRLVDICKKCGADTFYEPAGGKTYLASEQGRFEGEGIKLVFQNFRCPEYSQQFGKFIPDLSVVDLLFNEGEKSLNYIIKGGK